MNDKPSKHTKMPWDFFNAEADNKEHFLHVSIKVNNIIGLLEKLQSIYRFFVDNLKIPDKKTS